MRCYSTDEYVPYSCTITILDWLPIITDARYIDPNIDSLWFCRDRPTVRPHRVVRLQPIVLPKPEAPAG